MQRTLRNPSLVFLLLATSPAALADGKIVLTTRVKPAGIMRAVSEELKGSIEQDEKGITASRLTVRIESFDTGIGFRNDNFRKYLHADKESTAVVTALKGENGKAKADLELNGVKKPIDIEYERRKDRWTGRFKVKVQDFKLEPASYLGISTDDEVKAEVTIPVQAEEQGKDESDS